MVATVLCQQFYDNSLTITDVDILPNKPLTTSSSAVDGRSPVAERETISSALK